MELIALTVCVLIFPSMYVILIFVRTRNISSPFPTNSALPSKKTDKGMENSELTKQIKSSFLLAKIMVMAAAVIVTANIFYAPNKQVDKTIPPVATLEIKELLNEILTNQKLEISRIINNRIGDSAQVHAQLKSIQEEVSKLEKVITTTPSYHPAESQFKMSAVFISCIVLFIGLSATAFLIWKQYKWLGVTAAGLTGLTIGGLTIFDFKSVDGKLTLFENLYLYAQLPSPKSTPQLYMETLGEVKGFTSGNYQDYNLASLKALENKIDAEKSLSILIVIGEVDKRELDASKKEDMGSNITLARKRAEEVASRLRENKSRNQFILTLGRGAFHTVSAKETEMSDDRKVVVYGMSLKEL